MSSVINWYEDFLLVMQTDNERAFIPKMQRLKYPNTEFEYNGEVWSVLKMAVFNGAKNIFLNILKMPILDINAVVGSMSIIQYIGFMERWDFLDGILAIRSLNIDNYDEKHPCVLFFAISQNNYNACKKLLVHQPRRANPNLLMPNFPTFIARAIERQNFDIVKLLAETGANPNQKYGTTNMTCLHTACIYGPIQIVIYLVNDLNVDVNALTTKMEPPVLFAAASSNLNIADFLIESGVDINQKFENDETLIHIASKNSKFSAIPWLIQKGLNINAQNVYRLTALFFAVTSQSTYDQVKLLLDNGASTKYEMGAKNASIYHFAAMESSPEVMELLIDHSEQIERTEQLADFEFESDDYFRVKQTDPLLVGTKGSNAKPLFYAAVAGNLETFKLLVQRNVPLYPALWGTEKVHQYMFVEGDTCLHAICLKGDIKMFDFAIASCAPKELQNIDGNTPAMYAATSTEYEIRKKAILMNSNLNISNKRGQTVLHIICVIMSDINNIISMYNLSGPKIFEDIEFRRQHYFRNVIYLLELAKVSPNNAPEFSHLMSPLHILCQEHGNEQTIMWLLKYGANPNVGIRGIKSGDEYEYPFPMLPLHIAIKFRNWRTASFIFVAGMNRTYPEDMSPLSGIEDVSPQELLAWMDGLNDAAYNRQFYGRKRPDNLNVSNSPNSQEPPKNPNYVAYKEGLIGKDEAKDFQMIIDEEIAAFRKYVSLHKVRIAPANVPCSILSEFSN